MEPLRRSFRGYDPDQVDALLAEAHSRADGLQRELELLRAENTRLSDHVASMKSAPKPEENREKAIQDALVSAHVRAEEVLADARHEAEVLLQVARETTARLQDDLKGRIDDLNWQIERISLQKQRFANEFKSLLEEHLSELLGPEPPRPELSESPPEGYALAQIEAPADSDELEPTTR